MKWNPFSKDKRPMPTEVNERIEVLIARIEKFAPRKYRSEREVYYYNYKILDRYLGPLLGLLEILTEYRRMKTEELVFARDVFFRLKKFYDIKDKLTLDEAMDDNALKKRFDDLFLFFFGRKSPPFRELSGWLRDEKH